MPPTSQSTQLIKTEQTCSVLVVEDTQGKRAIILEQNLYSLGRDSKNSIVLHSSLVSRHHATVLKVTDSESQTYSFQIIDGDLQGNHSTNGLVINGKNCLSHTLKHGDIIVFGGKVKAQYLLINESASKQEILEYCELDDRVDRYHTSLDAFETIVPEEIEINPLTEAALLRLASFPELLPIPIVEIDLTGKITYLNPTALLEFPTLPKCQLQHPLLKDLLADVHNEEKTFFVREVELDGAIFEQSVHYLIESRLIRIYFVDITQRKAAENALKQLNEDLEIKVEKRTIELKQSIQQLQSEMAERQQAEAVIRYQASHDLLTGLANRTLFNEQLKLSLEYAEKNETLLAVMFLDLDRFKTINDTLGHAIGDQLLQSFAERLTTCLRSHDVVARWGGDEFTVLLPHIHTSEDAAKIAQRILDALKGAFNLEGDGKNPVSLHISSSIGIALYSEHGEDADTLLRNADAALYRAKKYGRNNYRFYIAEMNSQGSTLLKLENRLHQALERGEFMLYYQPQVNVQTLAVTGMEALLRWQHPELGLVPPGQFIPLAEENGLIVSIGEWVLETACMQNKQWQDAGFAGLRVAVNLSPRQFQKPDLVGFVAQVLSETNLAPELLELEITESTVMQNVEFASSMLRDLQKMGVHISMDDFGTGYSSLSYLKKFPFHTLKIDQSFVRGLNENAHDVAIVSAVLALGRSLNLRVVAEGVETQEQLQLLRRLQCEQMQGYLFSQPLCVEEATEVLNRCWLHKLTQNCVVEENAPRLLRALLTAQVS